MARVELLGIRHHGPGSARSMLAAFDALRPDLILVEGPPEATGLMGLVADPDLRPPVAILAYDPEEPERSAFYPFATFSPEWQAMRFAFSLARARAGRSIPAKMAMIAMTTRSSMRVKPVGETVGSRRSAVGSEDLAADCPLPTADLFP